MKSTTLVLSMLLLSACGDGGSGSTNEIDISGKWTVCQAITSLEIAYNEVVFSNNNSNFENTLFGGMDNQCIGIFPNPVIKTNGTLVLGNPHLSLSGLKVYDYTLINVSYWSNISTTTTSKPNFYSILYLSGDKLYFGKLTPTLDGSAESRRPKEINFSTFLTKQ